MLAKTYQCRECDERIYSTELPYDDEWKGEMIDRQLCFDCLFWTRILDKHNDGDKRCVVVDGMHYYAEDFYQKKYPFEPVFLGHGGRIFNVAWHDGRNVRTNNLWYQGEIPANFRSRMPDNARFIEDPVLDYASNVI